VDKRKHGVGAAHTMWCDGHTARLSAGDTGRFHSVDEQLAEIKDLIIGRRNGL
jgi:hypothetical protein